MQRRRPQKPPGKREQLQKNSFLKSINIGNFFSLTFLLYNQTQRNIYSGFQKMTESLDEHFDALCKKKKPDRDGKQPYNQ